MERWYWLWVWLQIDVVCLLTNDDADDDADDGGGDVQAVVDCPTVLPPRAWASGRC